MAPEEAMGAFESNHFPVRGYSNYSRQHVVAREVRPMDGLDRVQQNARDEGTGHPCVLRHLYIPVQRTRNDGIHELSRGSSAKLVNPGKTYHDIEMLHTFRLACAANFIILDLTA